MEQLLDVRALEPPEPLEQILDALVDLPEDDWLRVLHRRDPIPLYPMLREMGYRWQTTFIELDHFEILIWPRDLQLPEDTFGQGGGSA